MPRRGQLAQLARRLTGAEMRGVALFPLRFAPKWVFCGQLRFNNNWSMGGGGVNENVDFGLGLDLCIVHTWCTLRYQQLSGPAAVRHREAAGPAGGSECPQRQ